MNTYVYPCIHVYLLLHRIIYAYRHVNIHIYYMDMFVCMFT